MNARPAADPRLLPVRGPKRAADHEAIRPAWSAVSMLAFTQTGVGCRGIRHYVLDPRPVSSPSAKRKAYCPWRIRKPDDATQRRRYPADRARGGLAHRGGRT